MKTKGFTLVELLAVIVILAVIALIATPMILGVIETARKGAAESSALGYLDAIEKQIIINQVDSDATQIIDGTYDLPMEDVSIKGEVPEEGWIVIEDSQVINYSMKVMDYIVTKGSVATKEGAVAEKPSTEVSYICKRATTLHTEECTQTSDYCYASGYVSESEKGTTIEYGNLGTMGEELQSGDALDCDVDGTGYNHRFYYVTDLETNPEYAVLVYYSNTTNGVADNTSNSLIAYYPSVNANWYGPVKAIKNLPSKNDWSKVSLISVERSILTETGADATTGGSLPGSVGVDKFSYSKVVNGETVPLAARLLTYQELVAACGEGTPTSDGYLNNCKYLMENTKFSSSTLGTYGYWLETPRSSYTNSVWNVNGNYRNVYNNNASYVRSYGVRPVIEVLKSEILH